MYVWICWYGCRSIHQGWNMYVLCFSLIMRGVVPAGNKSQWSLQPSPLAPLCMYVGPTTCMYVCMYVCIESRQWRHERLKEAVRSFREAPNCPAMTRKFV